LSDRLLDSVGITFAVAFRGPLRDELESLLSDAAEDSEYQQYFLMLQTRRQLHGLGLSESKNRPKRLGTILTPLIERSDPPEFSWSEFLDVTASLIYLLDDPDFAGILSRGDLLEIVSKLERGCRRIPVQVALVNERLDALRSVAEQLRPSGDS